MKFQGVKCDNQICGYRDDKVDSSQYKAYINKPCPKCSQNLMTQSDYDKAMLVEKGSKYLGYAFIVLLACKGLILVMTQP